MGEPWFEGFGEEPPAALDEVVVEGGWADLDEKTLREGLETELGLVGGSQKEEWYDTWEEEEPKVIAEVEAQRLQEEEEEEEEE